MENDEIYGRIKELNSLMAQLNLVLKPLRQELIDLSRQFTSFYFEKERLEKKLIKITVVPEGRSGRTIKFKTDPTSLDARLLMMSDEDIMAFIAKAKERLEGGDK